MPPVQEENKNIPPGYTVLMGNKPQPRVSAFGQPRAIERGGGAAGTFIPSGQQQQVQPMQMSGMRLGAVRLANAHEISRPSVLGQNTTMGPPTQPSPDDGPNEKPVLPWQTDAKGKRLAWGKFKKTDAAELAAFLAEIEGRMTALNIPPGIVRQIRTKLESFVQSNVAPEAEVTISEDEAAQLNAAILSLETGEAQKPPSLATTAAVVAGLGLLSVIVLG